MTNIATARPVAKRDSFVSLTLLGAIVCVVAGGMVWSVWNGAAARAAFDQKRSEEIAQESRLACEKWKMPAGSREHMACVAELKVIRENHDKRHVEDAGML